MSKYRTLLLALVCAALVACSIIVSDRTNRDMIFLFGRRFVSARSDDCSFTGEPGIYNGTPMSEIMDLDLPAHAWFSDDECAIFDTRFARDYTIDTARLASFPRSGNTWTRYLLETSTGIFTSSGGPNYLQYISGDPRFRHLEHSEILNAIDRGKSSELVQMGYLGEYTLWSQGNTIVSKSHSQPQPWNVTDSNRTSHNWVPFPKGSVRRAILLIRDPFKAMISLRKYGVTKSVLSGNKNLSDRFIGKEWEDFAIYHTQHWYDLNFSWMKHTNDTLIVHYEILTKHPLNELQRMLDFLHVSPEPARICCIRKHLEGKAHNKKHSVVPDETLYNFNLRAEIWSHIHQLNNDLEDHGYAGLPLALYSFAEEYANIE